MADKPSGFHWQFLGDRSSDLYLPLIVDQQVLDQRRRFTLSARYALNLALLAVKRFKHPSLGTEHLLLGILGTPAPTVAEALNQWGVTQSKLQEMFEEQILPDTAPRLISIPVTPAFKQALHLAEQYAQQQQQPVGPEHLFLGILSDENETASVFLRRWGITYQRWLQSFSSTGEKP